MENNKADKPNTIDGNSSFFENDFVQFAKMKAVKKNYQMDELTDKELDDSFLITKYVFGRASNYMHRGNWIFTDKNGIKEWLIDGKHYKMFKIKE